MCYSPGIRLIAQWWPRRERGRALGTRGIFIGSAMLIMWLVTGWVAGAFWPAAFRYPVLWIGLMSLVFLLLAASRGLGRGERIGQSVDGPVSDLCATSSSPCLLGSIGGWFKSAQYSPSCRID